MENFQKDTKSFNLFPLFSILLPFLIIILALLNSHFGTSCADGCRKPMGNTSDIISHIIQIFLALLFFINIYFYKKYKNFHKREGICLIMMILNCLCCIHLSLGIINILAAALYTGIPMMIALPVQYFLWWYMLFSEILNKKGKYGLFTGFGVLVIGLIVRIIYLLLK